MLRREDKKEMLRDGQDPKRKRDFAKLREFSCKKLDSFDEYIQFLASAQKIFPGQSSRRKTVSKFNKL